MPLYPGQGLLLKGQFANGSTCDYERPFLIIDVNSACVSALNVSSIRGKERKLIMKSNLRLSLYRPPFVAPSFVKLDEVYLFQNFPELDQFLTSKGNMLDGNELNKVVRSFKSYNESNFCASVNISTKTIISLNPKIRIP